MIALQIASVKDFMNQLLAGDAFHPFLLEEAQITTSVSYTIDGHVHPAFYKDGTLPPFELLPWEDAKSICFQMIKGERTPILCKLVLQLKPESAEDCLLRLSPDGDFTNVKALLLMIKYEEAGVNLTTGISYHTFSMDREADRIWDRAICQYLTARGLRYEVL